MDELRRDVHATVSQRMQSPGGGDSGTDSDSSTTIAHRLATNRRCCSRTQSNIGYAPNDGSNGVANPVITYSYPRAQCNVDAVLSHFYTGTQCNMDAPSTVAYADSSNYRLAISIFAETPSFAA